MSNFENYNWLRDFAKTQTVVLKYALRWKKYPKVGAQKNSLFVKRKTFEPHNLVRVKVSTKCNPID